MDITSAISAMSALAQKTRLETFRLLMQHEPNGVAAGVIAEELCVPANTMSAHLTVLLHSGLITKKREGRSILYRANFDFFKRLNSFLLKDCCGGRIDMCQPFKKQPTKKIR